MRPILTLTGKCNDVDIYRPIETMQPPLRKNREYKLRSTDIEIPPYAYLVPMHIVHPHQCASPSLTL